MQVSISDKIIKSLTEERLNPYFSVTNDMEKALALYIWNIDVGGALYTSIHALEILLRNAIHTHLKINNEFWFDDDNIILLKKQRTDINNARAVLKNKKESLSAEKIIAKVPLSFWIELFSITYDTTLCRKIIKPVFPCAPKGTMRKKIYNSLKPIQQLRNSIAHHEPIFNQNLNEIHTEIYALIQWICTDSATWFQKHDRFQEVYTRNNQSLIKIPKHK